MTATVAPTSNFMHRDGANVRVSLNTTQRRSKAIDPAVSGSDARSWTSQTSVSATSNQRVGRHSLSSAPTVFRRKIIFLLNQDTGPVFPFNERAQNGRSHLRWPPWPHRLDNGHRKVSHGRRTFLSNNICVMSSAQIRLVSLYLRRRPLEIERAKCAAPMSCAAISNQLTQSRWRVVREVRC